MPAQINHWLQLTRKFTFGKLMPGVSPPGRGSPVQPAPAAPALSICVTFPRISQNLMHTYPQGFVQAPKNGIPQDAMV